MSDSYRIHLEAAKQRALAWTPDAEHVDPVRMTWQSAAACIIGIFTDAMHAAECEGCAVKAGGTIVNSAFLKQLTKWNPFESKQYDSSVHAGHSFPLEGYPHDNLPFHNVFEVDHSPGAQMLRELQAQLQTQNELLTLLQTQRDAYKGRLDALMNEGLLVDKTQYRIEFADETEAEVRMRLIPIDHAA